MKKVVLLALLILAISASVSMASAWDATHTVWTDDLRTLTSYGSNHSTLSVLTTATLQADNKWLWSNIVTLNPNTSNPIVNDFQISIGTIDYSSKVYSMSNTGGWIGVVQGSLLHWSVCNGNTQVGSVIDGSNKQMTFNYVHAWGPSILNSGSGMGSYLKLGATNTSVAVWDGDVSTPTAVPEPSSLVGFSTAMMVGAPGMLGWLKRRRS